MTPVTLSAPKMSRLETAIYTLLSVSSRPLSTNEIRVIIRSWHGGMLNYYLWKMEEKGILDSEWGESIPRFSYRRCYYRIAKKKEPIDGKISQSS